MCINKNMKVFVLFFSFAILASAYPGDRNKDDATKVQGFLVQDDSGVFSDLQDTEIGIKVTPANLKIYLYTKRNMDNPVLIENNEIEPLVNSGFFNSSARTISITHGWMDDHTSQLNTLLTRAILESNDVNVLISDWGSIAYGEYIRAKFAVPSIGKYLGSVIDKIVSRYQISHKQFTLIGHSLGAHVSGAAGSATEQKVDLIIGLDAAQPFFNDYDMDDRLDPSDADFVHVIHTGAGFLAISIPIGHSDFFPNGGHTQKGCGLDIAGSCSHGRSFQYLAESIRNTEQKFWSYKCKDYRTFEEEKCSIKDSQSFMGTLDPDRSARGSYYLYTNSKAPYCPKEN